MRKLVADSVAARCLGALAHAICRYPRWFFYPQVILFLACVLYTVEYLQFDTSRNNLVGANKKYHQNFLHFREEFPKQDDLVVVVESDRQERNRQFVERLGARLEAETNLFQDVFYKGDLKMLGNKALLFVSDTIPTTLVATNFKDLPAFARKLQHPTDPVSRYLANRLSDSTRRALATFDVSATNNGKLEAVLTNDLNTVLAEPGLFEARRFSHVPLRPETERLLATRPEGERLKQLNHLLLEDAYPEEITRADLDELLLALRTYRPFIEQFAHATNLASLFNLVNAQFRNAKREQSAETESLVKALPALERVVSQASECLHRPGAPPSPGVTSLFNASEEAERESYITFAKGRIYLVTAYAKSEEQNADAVKRLRELVEETRFEVPGVNVGVTGEPVLEQDEMAQSQKDTTVASIVALGLCALIFIYGYKETGRPVKATICLVVGLGYTMGFATFAIGHLNILTITFVPILIGLAIDFGVHLVTRYEEELHQGRSEEEALTKALVFTGQGIFTGAFTTAGGFLAMSFTQFKGIQEMGIICGGGLLVCLIPMMTLLPVLLLRGRQNVIDHARTNQPDRRAQIEQIWLNRPIGVTVITLVMCGFAAVQARKVYFDYNLLNMQSPGLPAVVFEQKLIDSADKSVLFGAVVTDSLKQAADWEARIKELPTVASVESLSRFLNEDQTRKLDLVREIKAETQPILFATPDPGPVDVHKLSVTLGSLGGLLGMALGQIKDQEPDLWQQLARFREVVLELRNKMLEGDRSTTEAHAAKLSLFQQALFADLRETFHALQTQDARAPLTVEDMPRALRDRFVGVGGKHLLQVYPKSNVWQRVNQKAFIDDLRAVDPNVTGTPVQLYEYTTLLKESYEEAAWYSLAAIAVLVFIHFRSLGAVLLALLPVGLGSLWLVGFMGWLEVPFNPANIMTLPLVIGIGVTNGIHILNRFAEEQQPGILARSTGKAVLVSGLTTIAGFGSLILAQHQGISSLGKIMSVGVAACMVAGLTFLPALLKLLLRRKPTDKKPSADNAQSTPGREEPR